MRPVRAFAALLAALLAPAGALAQPSSLYFTTAQRYDAMGRVTGTISASYPYLVVRNTYDSAGRLIAVETASTFSWQPESVPPSSWTGLVLARTVETTYDAMGRKAQERLRAGGRTGAIQTVTQYSYDIMGRLECTAVRMNPAVFGSLPSSACVHSTYDPAKGRDRITRNVYDDAGQRLQLRVGVGVPGEEAAEATWAYNQAGQISTIIDANGNRADLRYDGQGRQNCWMFPSAMDPDSRPMTYNDFNQGTSLESAGALGGTFDGAGQCATGDFEAYQYDLDSNRTDLRKRDGRHVAFAYDSLSRMTEKTYPQGGATPVYYGYNLQGLQLFARYSSASGAGITNTYDGLGRLRATSTDLAGTTRTLSYTYDRNGNHLSLVHPDGVTFTLNYDRVNRPVFLGRTGGGNIARTLYTSFGDINAVTFYTPSGPIGAQTTFGQDLIQRPYGIVHQITGGNVYWLFPRNAAGEISSITRDNDAYAWTSHYGVSRAYDTNGLNQYSGTASTTGAGSSSSTFGYDANGNLTANITGSDARFYGYDIENRLINAPGNVSLSYDPLGRLFQVAVGGGVTRTFLYDGDALVAEYAPNGTLAHRYVHRVGVDVPIVSYDGEAVSSPTFLFVDPHNSIVAHANASGALTAINRYDDYGIPASNTQGMSVNTGLFQYTGQIWLPEIGMYHYKARVYSPYLGRFMQTDPVGYDDQFNLYAYVENDPINRTDPSGRELIPSGSDADRQRMREFASRRTNLNVVEQDGKLGIEGDIPANSELNVPARELIAAINSEQSIPLNVVDGEQQIYMDAYVPAAIDIGDYEGAERANARAAGALFAHVLAEQRYAAEHFNGARTLGNFGAAHQAGAASESSAMGAFSVRQVPAQASTNSLVTRVYRDASGRVVSRATVRLDGNGTPGPPGR